MSQVYAVFAQEASDYYAKPELMKLFSTKDLAESYAETLQSLKTEPYYEGDEVDDKYCGVSVKILEVA